MASRPSIVIYCEDSGHEQFARALLGRIATDLGVRVDIRTASGRGGHGLALTEFKAWQRAIAGGGGIHFEIPDLLVLMIDANCKGYATVRRDLESSIDNRIFSHCAIGCPDPHIERWCLADPQALQEVLGVDGPADPGKCERHLYKSLLRETILKAGQPILTTAMEYAPDLIAAMDFFRAGRNQPSLKHFVDEVRSALQLFFSSRTSP
ncbi:MAG TPA: hypothetical protein VLB76_13510 [Thermoanaerobaculia bacterium]|jgi:hypothetical protein|nr:hypothetical protein [Thermoanaerobaculia bacterium]